MSQQENTEFLSNFAETIKAIRGRRGLSQEALAELLGVEPGAVGNWESGRNKPKLSRLKSIAEALDVSVEFLTGEKPATPMIGYPQTPVYMMVEEGAGRETDSGGVPTKEMCRRYLESFLDTCSDPGKVSWTFYQLQDHFPLNKWKKGK